MRSNYMLLLIYGGLYRVSLLEKMEINKHIDIESCPELFRGEALHHALTLVLPLLH